MPAACTRASRSAPMRLEGVSPIMPRARLAITMRRLSIACSKCRVLRAWPITLRIAGEKRKASILFKTGRDRFLAIAVAPALELSLEKGAGQGIGDASDNAGAKASVGEKPRQQRKRCIRRLDQRGGRMAKNLFETRAPHVRPYRAHARNHPVGHDRAMIRRDILKHVEADGIRAVGEIEIADLIVAGWRHERTAPSRRSRRAGR